jgi:hypothetical protein
MVEQYYTENQEQLARLQFELAEMQLYQREATRRLGMSVKPRRIIKAWKMFYELEPNSSR